MYMFIISILTLIIVGCGDGGSDQGEGKENKSKGTIGVSVLTLGNPFFSVIAEEIKNKKDVSHIIYICNS